MTLILKRPLVIFDLETTGVNVASDRIVEISALKANPDGTEETKTFRINPEMPIPLESSLIHGIYQEDIADAPTFREVAQELADFIGDADLGGYNSNRFDIPVLMEEFLRVNVPFDIENRFFVDVQNIFHQMEQRTLKAAYKFYCEKDLIDAHSAEADVIATFEVLKAQVLRYENKEWEDKSGKVSIPVKNDIEALHKFTNLNKTVDFAGRMVYDNEGIEIFSFGKHKGRAVEEIFKIEPSYYAWMMKGDFPMYTKTCLERIWNRSRQSQAKAPDAPKKSQQIGESSAQAKPPVKTERERPKESSKPPRPISADMLKSLQDKFGK
ncbi:3'-5' exonuclease [Albibacterium bauzanense]|uniref:DNA polymerase-3 subunit epsilon n=1 Tax=Albibacterium bauzanense TaxID=653929 RepID=A0A4R1M0T4_9SPHI|nr:3'-5' exonuclease [Albibacterium bauzanense]TCK85225.1 DNA polymerase-3 subunit epsilon [Albibacterium bauzanense]